MTILYQMFMGNFDTIYRIEKVDENKFDIYFTGYYTAEKFSRTNKGEELYEKLMEIGFLDESDTLIFTNTNPTNIGTWACSKTTVSFNKWEFKRFSNY